MLAKFGEIVMKTAMVVLLVIAFTAINSFAGCGPVKMPVEISSGKFFVSNGTIRAMGGDPTKPIVWTGDGNYWGETPTESYTFNGEAGILVSGVGHDFNRWNLRQNGHPNNGWLAIEEAFPLYGCPNIYTRGKLTPSGHDWKGRGPAFWYVAPKVKVDIEPKD